MSKRNLKNLKFEILENSQTLCTDHSFTLVDKPMCMLYVDHSSKTRLEIVTWKGMTQLTQDSQTRLVHCSSS